MNVFALRNLARAELSNSEKAYRLIQYQKDFSQHSTNGHASAESTRDTNPTSVVDTFKYSLDHLTEDEVCIVMESLSELRSVDKNTSKVFYSYLFDEKKRYDKLSYRNRIRAIAGLRDLRLQHPKYRNILTHLTKLLDDRQALIDRGLFMDALLHIGRLQPLESRKKHQFTSMIKTALEEGLGDLWGLPRACQTLKIHDEKLFTLFADRLKVEHYSLKQMLELSRGLERWEVGPPGMKRSALTVYCNSYQPTASETYLWIRALSRIKTNLTINHITKKDNETEEQLQNETIHPFIQELYHHLPFIIRKLNAEKLVLLTNALTFGFTYDAITFQAVATEIEKQLPLDVYDFDDLATLFRASWYLKSMALAMMLQKEILKKLPTEPTKAASKILYGTTMWSQKDSNFLQLMDHIIPITLSVDRVQVLPLTLNPGPIVASVAEELCFLSRPQLLSCVNGVRDEKTAASIMEEFDRIGLRENDIWNFIQNETINPWMRPLILKYSVIKGDDNNKEVAAACRDLLFWEKQRTVLQS